MGRAHLELASGAPSISDDILLGSASVLFERLGICNGRPCERNVYGIAR